MSHCLVDCSGCRFCKPYTDARPSAEPEDEEIDPSPYFCFCCEVANVTRSDEDRCCLMCGMDLIPLSQLKETLAKIDLAIVPIAEMPSAEERAVLEACAALKPVPHLFMAGSGMSVADADRVMTAELARRAAKGKT